MKKILIVGGLGGILFAVLDGLINANPWAQKLFEVYKPIAKKSVNVPAGMVIDLVYGVVMAWIFVTLYPSLMGTTGWQKGICFGLIAWFFRVMMQVASQWMMYKVPIETLVYSLVTGLFEMLILGVFYGLTLKVK